MDDEDFPGGTEAIVSGWGSTIEKGPSSNIPMKVRTVLYKQSAAALEFTHSKKKSIQLQDYLVDFVQW